MHIHHLNAKLHSHILQEQRFDPITGEVLKAGDEVVFCAVCQSAFLDESWNYIGGQHCNQSETLSYPPTPRKALALEKREAYPPIYKTMWDPYAGVRWEQVAKLIFAVFLVLMLFRIVGSMGQPDPYAPDQITVVASSYTDTPRPASPVYILKTQELDAPQELFLNEVGYKLKKAETGKLNLFPLGKRVSENYTLDQKDDVLLRCNGTQVQLLQVQPAKSELLPITEWLPFSDTAVELKSVSLSPDHTKAALVTQKGWAFLFDFIEKRIFKTWFLTPSGEAVWLPLDEDHWDIVLALDDGKGKIQFYDTYKMASQTVFSYTEDDIVKLSPQGNAYLTCSPKGGIQVYDLQSGFPKGNFVVTPSMEVSVSEVEFSVAGNYIVASGKVLNEKEDHSFTAIWELPAFP